MSNKGHRVITVISHTVFFPVSVLKAFCRRHRGLGSGDDQFEAAVLAQQWRIGRRVLKGERLRWTLSERGRWRVLLLLHRLCWWHPTRHQMIEAGQERRASRDVQADWACTRRRTRGPSERCCGQHRRDFADDKTARLKQGTRHQTAALK